jgi:hypothetical protein
MRWASQVTRTGEGNEYKIWPENLKGGENLRDLGVDGRIIGLLKLILGK